MTDPALPLSEREQTDESLRLERDKAGRALDQDLGQADDAADVVISLRAHVPMQCCPAHARRSTNPRWALNQPTR